MSLQDLTEHVPALSSGIHELVGHADLFSHSGPIHSAWDTFRRSVWGKGVASFEFPGPIEGDASALPETIPASRPVMEVPTTVPNFWDMDISRILVRSEFQEAERAALSANAMNMDAFVVAGQPEIGKSVFLMWLLVRRLALGLPTALQVRKDHAVLFHEGGTSIFLELSDVIPYLVPFKPPPHTPGKIWALIDSNRFLPEPVEIFMRLRPFFTVEAVSPYQPGHIEWSQSFPSDCFYMRPWDLSEIIQARPFIGLSNGGPYEEHELRHLYNTYGASPTSLSKFSRNPEAYKDLVTKQAQGMSAEALRYALRIRESDYSSHLLVVVEPSLEQRYSCQKRVASREVFEILWDQHIKNQPLEILRFYYFFRESPVTAPAAGWVFELWMHLLLRGGTSLPLSPIGGRTVQAGFIYDDYTSSLEGENTNALQLTRSGEYRLGGEVKLEVGRYYRLKAADFYPIHSLFLIHSRGEPSPILLMFWIAWNETEQTVNEGSLQRICGLECPPDTRRRYVVVTPSGAQPRMRVPRTILFHRGQEDTVPVNVFPAFHFEISMGTYSDMYYKWYIIVYWMPDPQLVSTQVVRTEQGCPVTEEEVC